MFILIENGLGKPSSNPEKGCLHFTLYECSWEGMNPPLLIPAMDK